jgi:hypothetical protein
MFNLVTLTLLNYFVLFFTKSNIFFYYINILILIYKFRQTSTGRPERMAGRQARPMKSTTGTGRLGRTHACHGQARPKKKSACLDLWYQIPVIFAECRSNNEKPLWYQMSLIFTECRSNNKKLLRGY